GGGPEPGKITRGPGAGESDRQTEGVVRPSAPGRWRQPPARRGQHCRRWANPPPGGWLLTHVLALAFPAGFRQRAAALQGEAAEALADEIDRGVERGGRCRGGARHRLREQVELVGGVQVVD